MSGTKTLFKSLKVTGAAICLSMSSIMVASDVNDNIQKTAQGIYDEFLKIVTKDVQEGSAEQIAEQINQNSDLTKALNLINVKDYYKIKEKFIALARAPKNRYWTEKKTLELERAISRVTGYMKDRYAADYNKLMSSEKGDQNKLTWEQLLSAPVPTKYEALAKDKGALAKHISYWSPDPDSFDTTTVAGILDQQQNLTQEDKLAIQEIKDGKFYLFLSKHFLQKLVSLGKTYKTSLALPNFAGSLADGWEQATLDTYVPFFVNNDSVARMLWILETTAGIELPQHKTTK